MVNKEYEDVRVEDDEGEMTLTNCHEIYNDLDYCKETLKGRAGENVIQYYWRDWNSDRKGRYHLVLILPSQRRESIHFHFFQLLTTFYYTFVLSLTTLFGILRHKIVRFQIKVSVLLGCYHKDESSTERGCIAGS